MKKITNLLLILVAGLIGFTGCIEGNDKPDQGEGPGSSIEITSNITTNTTWETGKIYVLAGRITVTSGATLTIQPGVVVKGQVGSGANATALIIARGGRINAAGTATQPIIFTTVADEIIPGQIASPNLEPTLEGLWGGIIVLGRARGSFAGDVQEIQIEGIPASDTNGLYGGTNDADNSGVIKYVSIRHGGANIGEGNEINGLTLGGVGSGTVIENVEVVANQDDGIEWFGGTVSVKNALVWNSGDDAVDTDQSWAGILDNFIVICGVNTDHALEIDGPEGSYNAAHTVRNGSIKGHPSSEFADFRAGARGTFENLYFFNFPSPAANNNAGRGDLSLSGDLTVANFANGILKFSKLEATLTEGVTLQQAFRNGTDVHASSVALKANTIGANKAVFTGWTWAAAANALADFK
ncbi:hypothetical protein SAMN03080617_04228 [Algoriphagus alkaliphilus]|uniref:Right handed beta helix region n=1 Tax=Algoriphagus alkaliphilus TaxID=279824 RepID=A0A1G5ZPB1_9BACT|nr:hypothetical protein [Algoriphagus alkaliphilus]SDA96442.1 hypothetical protein SAMN03080617_04228 [Algoriphagus alkaliphilus]